MRNRGRVTEFLVISVICFMGVAAVAQSSREDTRPTVRTWIAKDPFPDTAPRANALRVVAEANTTTRTPSVLLQVYDVEYDKISVKTYTQPEHGKVRLQKDGTFLYTPEENYTGEDQFTYTLTDGKPDATDVERATATVRFSVIPPATTWSTTHFTDIRELRTPDGEVVDLKSCATPRLIDWNGDGRTDLLVGCEGKVLYLENTGTKTEPIFSAGIPIGIGEKPFDSGRGRTSIALADADGDGVSDLWIISNDRVIRYVRVNRPGRNGTHPELAELVTIREVGRDGGEGGENGEKSGNGEVGTGEFQAMDIRADIADWNGDGVPDLITGNGTGAIRIAYGIRGETLAFANPVEVLDDSGTKLSGSYNLNVRMVDLNHDGVPDLSVSYNWGNIDFRINRGTHTSPDIAKNGQFSLSWGASTMEESTNPLDMHAMTNGPLCDWGDLDGDGCTDLIFGSENNGKIRFAHGENAGNYVAEIRRILEQYPEDIASQLAQPGKEAEKDRLCGLLGSIHDYLTGFATPSQKKQIGRELSRLIRDYPQYFRLQTFDIEKQPGMPSLAGMIWLNLLMTGPDDPAIRAHLAKLIHAEGGYRKLIEEIGLLYFDNAQNPEGAEAIYQWVRYIPRDIYPGRGITAADWMGGKTYMPRGHLKNTFNGNPVDQGEYGFGSDAREVIGDRGSENWFMTVVKHEASHDVDAYVRGNPELNRRWGQMLVRMCGPEMRGAPETGWPDRNATKRHFQKIGLWDGNETTWDDAWKKYWEEEPGKSWKQFGFMRGNAPWFLDASQESLATQGNQFWNSTEGRIQVAIARYDRGFTSNLSEVLFYLEIWSVGYDKIKFFETDNACRQEIRFAQLRRNEHGYIDRIDLGDHHVYEFEVTSEGVVTKILRRGKPDTDRF